jgi:hypothetical protein
MVHVPGFSGGSAYRPRRGQRRASFVDPWVFYFAHQAYKTVNAAWAQCVHAYGFEPYGTAFALTIIFAERVMDWVPVRELIALVERANEIGTLCPSVLARHVTRYGISASASMIAKTCFAATCVHATDMHAIYNLGSLFLKTSELEKRIRASASRATAVPATVGFVLALGALTNAVAILSACTIMTNAYNSCVSGSTGLLFALKTYRARVDYRDGVRSRVSFFGFIDVSAHYAALVEIAILYMLDHSPASMNLYLSGCFVGLVLAQFERPAMNFAAALASGVARLASGVAPSSIRVGSRVVLRDMRQGSLNGQWGVVVSVRGDEIGVNLDVDARTVTALRANVIVV